MRLASEGMKWLLRRFKRCEVMLHGTLIIASRKKRWVEKDTPQPIRDFHPRPSLMLRLLCELVYGYVGVYHAADGRPLCHANPRMYGVCCQHCDGLCRYAPANYPCPVLTRIRVNATLRVKSSYSVTIGSCKPSPPYQVARANFMRVDRSRNERSSVLMY